MSSRYVVVAPADYHRSVRSAWVASLAALLASLALSPGSAQRTPRRNVLLFVADGLRAGSVNERDTPAIWRIRTQGVDFENSHAVFPTFTMANAATIATGYAPGDTGIFSNTVWPGFALFDGGTFGLVSGTPVPFLENDHVLADVNAHFDRNMLGADTLVAAARAHGYRTAVVGKLGPTALQDAASLVERDGALGPTHLPGVIVDDATGGPQGVPLPDDLLRDLAADHFPKAAPTRSNGYDAASQYSNGFPGGAGRAGTLLPNVVQQRWFADLTTRYILPWLSKDETPFVLVFWSRDPDGTQHNQGDSLGDLAPGINGPTSRASSQNADQTLQRLLDWLDAHPSAGANTDVVVTSDHGFATISRSRIDSRGTPSAAESARHDYVGPAGGLDTPRGTLPIGFLAIDLAYDLGWNLFDPDVRIAGSRLFRRVNIGKAGSPHRFDTWEHPQIGNGLIGDSVRREDGSDARLIVAANGGSDLIYVPDRSEETVRRVVERLLSYDYVGAIFVDDRYGHVAGTLSLSSINLAGKARLPRPALVVSFKVFYGDGSDLQTAVQISDTSLQEGQGMHGGFGRDSTLNAMAAAGPDFKSAFVDRAPVGNGDLTPTIAHILGIDLGSGPSRGRVLREALKGGGAGSPPAQMVQRSHPAGRTQTVLLYQVHEGVRYLDRACLSSPSVPDAQVCR